MSVTPIRPLNAPEATLTKQQIAAHLGRSVRWVELRMREGLPSVPPTTRDPHRRFRLSEVQRWLEGGEKKLPGHAERIAELEAQVARLSATVERLERRAS